MARFTYRAIDHQGENLTGIVEASSEDEARKIISGKGFFPAGTTFTGDKRKNSPSGSGDPYIREEKKWVIFDSAVNDESLSIFTRQLTTLLQAKMPLLRSLEVLFKQEKNAAFRSVIAGLMKSVRSGNTFSESLAKHPKVFDQLYFNIVKAGETGGAIDTVLLRLTQFMEKRRKLKQALITAMIYPLIVLMVAIVIVAILFLIVVPRFRNIYQELLKGDSLPLPTQLVIDGCAYLQHHGWTLMAILTIVVIALKYSFFIHPLSRLLDWISLRIPYLGDLVRKVSIARFTRTLGTLLSSGVPLPESFSLTRDVISNRIMKDSLKSVYDCLLDGESIAVALERVNIFPPMVSGMISVGEEIGELPTMLNRIADSYDDEVDFAVAGFTTIIEPFMIILLALVIGFIVVALFLPIIDIIQRLTGG